MMHRILVLLAFCVSCALAGFQSSQYLSSAFRNRVPSAELNFQQSAQENRRRRRDIDVHPLEDPQQCLANCSHGLDAMNNISDTASDQVAATHICKTVESVEACYKKCPSSLFRTLLLDFTPTMKMPCILGDDKYSELEKVQTCLNSTDDQVMAKCDPKCNSTLAANNDVENRIILNVNPPFIMYDNNKKANTVALSSTCQYLVCSQQCAAPIQKAKCGQVAVETDRKITASVFGSIVKLYTDVGATDPIPECQPLTQ